MSQTLSSRQTLATALCAVLTCSAAVAQASNGVVHARNSAAVAQTRPLVPLSVAWRKNYMLHHGFVNHAGSRGVLQTASSGKYLYVADYNLGVVLVFDATSKSNPAPLGFISDGVTYPSALAVDANKNLYVANEGNSTVTVYAPGSTVALKSFATIFPLAMNFGPDGTLYVGGEGANSANQIEIFPRSGTPAIVGSPADLIVGGIAVRPTNVVTVSVNDQNQNGYIYVYPNGIQQAPLQVAGANGGLLEGLSYDAAGNLYASNFNKNEVYVYAPQTYQETFITNGVARPIGNAFSDSTLFVANSGIPDVTAYKSVTAAPIVYSQDMTFPTAVAVSTSGLSTDETSIYTVQECNCSEVDVYTTTLPHPTQTAAIGQGVHTPSGVALDSAGNIYLANNGTHIVTELAVGTRKPKAFWTLNDPYAVSVDRAGTLYVSDQGVGAVEILPAGKSSPTGSFSCGNSYQPQYLTVDSSNNVYVACGTDVLMYTASTKATKLLGLKGLQYAVGVAFDAGGNLYVSDELKNKIDVYAPKATSPMRVITNGISEPHGIHIGSSGKLYVTSLSGGSNPIYAPNGSTPIGTIAGPNLLDITTGQ